MFTHGDNGDCDCYNLITKALVSCDQWGCMKISGVKPGNLASTSLCLCNIGKNHLSLLVQAPQQTIGDQSVTYFTAP